MDRLETRISATYGPCDRVVGWDWYIFAGDCRYCSFMAGPSFPDAEAAILNMLYFLMALEDHDSL